jgi:hypothetical protein
VTAIAERLAGLPASDPVAMGRGRLRQFFAYARRVFGLVQLLDGVRDRRRRPQVATAVVARIVFLVGLLRIRSFNALDPKLGEAAMQRALGALKVDGKVCSVDTLSYSLKRMDVDTARATVVATIKKAERNKVFREGWCGAMRFVAIDGWEPFCSRSRHCPACLTRQVKTGKEGKTIVTEYYHAFVVALLLDQRLELVLDMEPIRSSDVRKEAGDGNAHGHEGELTAAKRLVTRLRTTYGRWIDVLVVDALYPNGPFFTTAKNAGYGVIAVAKKNSDEPLKEALSLWNNEEPKVVFDEKKKERIELWDCPDIETLSTYRGPIRVVRAIVHKQAANTTHTWCFAVTGVATRLSARQVIQVGRARWHLENTGFYQWSQYWRFAHVFTHNAQALPALFWIFFLAFNLLQLFLYRQLCSYGRDRGKDVTRTIWRVIDEMVGELERLDRPLSWNTS